MEKKKTKTIKFKLNHFETNLNLEKKEKKKP